MNNVDDVVLYIGGVAILAGLASILNAIFFQFKYQKLIDQQFHGDNYIDGGWLFNSTRMLMYAHYCLFPARAQKDRVSHHVDSLSLKIKLHLIFNWIATLCAVCFGFLAGGIVKWYS